MPPYEIIMIRLRACACARVCVCACVNACVSVVPLRILGECWLNPGLAAHFLNLNPPESIFCEEGVKMLIFTLLGPKFAQFQPGVAGVRVAGWLAETLVRVVVCVRACAHAHACVRVSFMCGASAH
jgi:hypothetical protein